jgi:excisionase family DNA binding protein
MPRRPSSPSPPELKPLLDSEQLARILGVTYRTLDTWAYRREGPAYIRVGRHRRYDPADVRAWLDAQRRRTNGIRP